MTKEDFLNAVKNAWVPWNPWVCETVEEEISLAKTILEETEIVNEIKMTNWEIIKNEIEMTNWEIIKTVVDNHPMNMTIEQAGRLYFHEGMDAFFLMYDVAALCKSRRTEKMDTIVAKYKIRKQIQDLENEYKALEEKLDALRA